MLYLRWSKLFINLLGQMKLILLKPLKSYNELLPHQTHLTQLTCDLYHIFKIKAILLWNKIIK